MDGRSVTSKLAAILRTFSNGQAYSLSDVARAADIPISTAHRLVSELVEWGFLDRSADKRYRVGSLLTQIGGNVLHVTPIRSQADQVLDDLATALRTTVRFGVLDAGMTVTCIEKHPTRHRPVRTETRQMPVHATAAGKVLLAFSDPETVNAAVRQGFPRFTDATIVTASALRRELTLVRMSQLAWCRREFNRETTSIATPVFARGGQVVAALEVCLSGPSPQLRLPAVQPALILAGRALTRQFAVNEAPGAAAENLAQRATVDGRLA